MSEWAPSAKTRVFQSAEKGAVLSVPKRAPSAKNSTRATPTASEAVAWTVTVRLTVELAAGAVMLTWGAVLSMVTATPLETAKFPEVS